ncbi:unnamed protein product [Brassica oleracea var. botrytis]
MSITNTKQPKLKPYTFRITLAQAEKSYHYSLHKQLKITAPDRTIDFGFSCSGESGVTDSVETFGQNFLPVFDILNVTPIGSHQRSKARDVWVLQQTTE